MDREIPTWTWIFPVLIFLWFYWDGIWDDIVSRHHESIILACSIQWLAMVQKISLNFVTESLTILCQKVGHGVN